MTPHNIHNTTRNALLKPAEVANLLNISLRTLEAWRYRGNGPKFIRISSRCIRYRAVDLEDWKKGKEQYNTCSSGLHNA